MRRHLALGRPISSAEITPERVYSRRRAFLGGTAAATAGGVIRGAMGGGLGGALGGAIGGSIAGAILAAPGTALGAPSLIDEAAHPLLPNVKKTPYKVDEKLTPWKDAVTYNNFYEFGTAKSDPAENAHSLRTRPWTVVCEGELKKPQTLDIDKLLKQFPLEDRIYRFRCVEAWSMVIPWVGFPLGALLQSLEPTSKAKYVAFETLRDPSQMPGQRRGVLDWPYVEGLRLDEAMHPLTLLAVGVYGRVLPNQNGAPIRLVVPWKYGFKSIKSVVKIRLVEKQPPTSWNVSAPGEYGFYSNVNPEVDHPRWSQARERRIGEFLKRQTLFLNGYAEQVAGLYKGLDLKANY